MATTVNRTDTFEQWRTKTNTISTDLGTVGDLTTTATNAVAAINELKTGTVTFSGTKTFSSSINLTAGNSIVIDSATVLSKTSLGSGVTGSSLTSVGTIGTGTWQGTIVAPTYGGTGVNNGSRTITLNTGNLTLTAQSGGSSVTVPSTGTLATVAGSEVLTNKTFTDSTTLFQDDGDNTRKFQFQVSGVTAGATRTLTVPDSDGTLALRADTHYIGTTAVALNRSSANQALTGISSVAFPGSSSGNVTVQATATAGSNTITLPATTGTFVTTGDTGTVTNAMLAGSIANAKLTNSSVTIGSTNISLGATSTSLAGLTSTTYAGSTSGNIVVQATATAGANTITLPATTGTVVTTGDSATVTNTMLAGSIANNKLSNSSVTIGSTNISLGATSTTLAGLTSVTMSGSSSGTVQIVPVSAVGTGTVLTIPATTGTIVTTGDSGTVTNTMLAGSIANSKLSNSAITIAGTSTSLGGSISQDTITGLSTTGLIKRTGTNTLAIAAAGTDYVVPSGNITGSAGSVANALTIGTGLSGTSYNGSAAVTITNTGVLSIAGTSNQVIASASTGAITLSLPQSIGTGSSPSFSGLSLTTLNVSDTITDTVNIAPASAKTLISVVNNNAAYTTAPNRFTVDSAGNVTVQGTLTVIGGSSLGTVSSTIGWSNVVNKVFYGKFTDGTTTAAAANVSANDDAGDTFKYRGSNGVTVTVANNDVTHGDNLLISLASVPNSSLANSKVTIGTTDISLGASSTTLAGLTQTTFASGGGGTIAIAPGSTASAISLTLPTASGTLVVQDSSNFAFQNIAIGADSGYTWGSANSNTTQAADSNTDTLTIVRGLTGSTAGIDLFTSTVGATDAIKIAHADTSALSGGYNPIAGITVDELGHVTAVTSTNVTAGTNSIGTSTGNLTISSTGGTTTLSDNVIVSGNLTVSGTTTTINSTTLDVADLNITVAKGAANSAAANGAGITVDGANATMLFTSATERFVFNRAIQSTQGIQGTTYYGTGAGLTAGTVSNTSLANSTFTVNGSTFTLGQTYTGITGLQGIQGIQGTQGTQGQQGITGSQGTQGTQGQQGITGSQGTQGTQGQQGITGSQGTQGTQGQQGITGSQGTQGTIGTQGINGTQGTQGTQGQQGITGSQGITGIQGAQGIQGYTGPSTAINATANTTTNTLYPVMVAAAGSNQTPYVTDTSGYLTFNASNGSLRVASLGVGNAASGTAGDITATRFIKSGGTSGQFLKANGSVDSTTYVDLSSSQSLTNKTLGASNTFGGTFSSATVDQLGLQFQSYNNALHVYTILHAGDPTGLVELVLPELSGTLARTDDVKNSTITLSAGTGLSGGGSFTLNQSSGSTITLSLPQAVSTTSNVQFGSIGVGTAASGTSGEIRATDNVTAYYSSDERLKTNVKKIDNALDKVSQINGVIYDWTEDYKKIMGGMDGYFVRDQNSGIIAQEVEKVFPNVVAQRDNGYKAVRYELLVPLLIEAIKELKAEVESLKK